VTTREHLGERISALVDGELSHADRERALFHVANCATCRAALEEERAIKSRVAALAAPDPGEQLLARLRDLAAPGEPMPPDRPSMPGGRPRRAVVPPPGRPPAGRRPRGRGAAAPVRGSHRRLQLVAAGTLSAVVVVMGTAFVAGGASRQPGSPVSPPVDQFSVEHAATGDGLPLSDPAFTAVTTSSFGIPAPLTAVSLVPTASPSGR
jgi:anti-sigma factor RsiW